MKDGTSAAAAPFWEKIGGGLFGAYAKAAPAFGSPSLGKNVLKASAFGNSPDDSNGAFGTGGALPSAGAPAPPAPGTGLLGGAAKGRQLLGSLVQWRGPDTPPVVVELGSKLINCSIS